MTVITKRLREIKGNALPFVLGTYTATLVERLFGSKLQSYYLLIRNTYLPVKIKKGRSLAIASTQ